VPGKVAVEVEVIVKYAVKFCVAIWAVVLLSSAIGIAQSRLPQEAGRGFPYSSGGEVSWWQILVVVFVLVIVFTVAGKVKDTLEDQHWWHTLALVVATFLAALLLSAALYADVAYPVEPGFVIFMLIPSFVGIGLLYLAIMRLVQIMQDKGSK
jgi:hypothetical protein